MRRSVRRVQDRGVGGGDVVRRQPASIAEGAPARVEPEPQARRRKPLPVRNPGHRQAAGIVDQAAVEQPVDPLGDGIGGESGSRLRGDSPARNAAPRHPRPRRRRKPAEGQAAAPLGRRRAPSPMPEGVSGEAHVVVAGVARDLLPGPVGLLEGLVLAPRASTSAITSPSFSPAKDVEVPHMRPRCARGSASCRSGGDRRSRLSMASASARPGSGTRTRAGDAARWDP